jgi:hypothetical protein
MEQQRQRMFNLQEELTRFLEDNPGSFISEIQSHLAELAIYLERYAIEEELNDMLENNLVYVVDGEYEDEGYWYLVD